MFKLKHLHIPKLLIPTGLSDDGRQFVEGRIRERLASSFAEANHILSFQ